MPTSLHMTNTVFIDRAIIVQVKYFLSYSQIFLLPALQPFLTNDIPDELSGMEFASSSMPRGDSKLPSHVETVTEGGQILTVDESLADQGTWKNADAD